MDDEKEKKTKQLKKRAIISIFDRETNKSIYFIYTMFMLKIQSNEIYRFEM